MINGQGEILNQAEDQLGDQAGDQVLNQVQDQDKDQFTSSRVAGRDVSMGAIEIDSSTSAKQELMAPVNLFPEDPDQIRQTLQQPNSSSTAEAENSRLITRGSDPQNNDQKENDQKKLDKLKRYRDLLIVGALFSTLGLVAGVAMAATQFPAGMISVVAVPFLIAVPLGVLTFSLRILSLTNKDYQQQLSKCEANQQANQQNNARSSNNQSQDGLSDVLLSESRDLEMPMDGGGSRNPSSRPSSPETRARSLGVRSSHSR